MPSMYRTLTGLYECTPGVRVLTGTGSVNRDILQAPLRVLVVSCRSYTNLAVSIAV